jgi:hypothetical protein
MPQLDFYIDPNTGDLDMSNSLRLTEEGGESIAQKVRIRLQFFFAEWRLNPKQGTKWFEIIFKKGTSDYNVNQEIQRRVLNTEGVRFIENFTFIRNAPLRTFSCAFDIITDYDTVEQIVLEDIKV